MNNRPFTYADCIYNYNGINQYEWLINRLTKKTETKSATISLFPIGSEDLNLPCLVLIDAKIRDNKLNLQFFFRSQNILGRQYANLLAISKLQQDITNDLNIDIGFLAGYIASAHIYGYDFEYAEKFLNNEDILIKDKFYTHGPMSIRNNSKFK